jgi:hypothetical protein
MARGTTMKNQKSRNLPRIKPANPVELWLQTEFIKEVLKTSQPNGARYPLKEIVAVIHLFFTRLRFTARIWFHNITTHLNRFLDMMRKHVTNRAE